MNQVYQAITDISGLTVEISATAEQQSSVAEEISRNIININESSLNNLEQAKTVEAEAEVIDKRSIELAGLGKSFGGRA